MRFLVIFIILISNTYANETPNIKNLIINKELKEYTNLTVLDDQNNQINLSDYKGNILLLNFWATWCAPCKEEMPSLDLLKSNKGLNKLKIFPVNVGQDNVKKAKEFFDDLNIKNLNLYFDENINLTKKFALRGIPTSILLNKNGKEFARVIGSIDFNEENFVEWLKLYN
ncbi:TlpA family protein disulfide reductase [Candidatus Pelagibacter sp.]|nr:TlpA family protein disulfide reductase [Candidatus Pelagibacter sp.]